MAVLTENYGGKWYVGGKGREGGERREEGNWYVRERKVVYRKRGGRRGKRRREEKEGRGRTKGWG